MIAAGDAVVDHRLGEGRVPCSTPRLPPQHLRRRPVLVGARPADAGRLFISPHVAGTAQRLVAQGFTGHSQRRRGNGFHLGTGSRLRTAPAASSEAVAGRSWPG